MLSIVYHTLNHVWQQKSRHQFRMTICNSRVVKGRNDVGVSIVMKPFYLFMFTNTRCHRTLAQDSAYKLHTMLTSLDSCHGVVIRTWRVRCECLLRGRTLVDRSAETSRGRWLVKQRLDCNPILSASLPWRLVWRCRSISEPMVGMIHNHR